MSLNLNKTILVVDDDESGRISLAKILEKESFLVDIAENGVRALEKLRNKNYNLVITDLKMAEMDGLELLKAVKVTQPDIQVILITAFGTVETAVEAMKVGAFDFISKPLKRAPMLRIVNAALEKQSLLIENKMLKHELESFKSGQIVIGSSQNMREVMKLVSQVAPTQATILLEGESGTGKEIIAHSIHYASGRKDKPFLKISCAALPETLLEAELFGYEKGAFTGAVERRIGRFEAAHGGTLLLDEIGEIPLSIQVKLLRMLQESEIQRLGSTKPLTFDVRVIAATNKDLEKALAAKQFREDLYYRLNVVKIKIPPLRERREDIPLLAENFLKVYRARSSKNINAISSDALKILMNYGWPGNVRELENTIERAVVLTTDDTISPDDLPENMIKETREIKNAVTISVGTPLKDVENLLIEETLKKVNGDKSLAAKILGITSRTIYRKVKK